MSESDKIQIACLKLEESEILLREAHNFLHSYARSARMEAGISLQEMGNMMGISAQRLSYLERGNRKWNFNLAKSYYQNLP